MKTRTRFRSGRTVVAGALLALVAGALLALAAVAPAHAEDGAADSVRNGMDDAADSTKRGLTRAGEAVGEALDTAISKTGEGVSHVLEKTGDGIQSAGRALSGTSAGPPEARSAEPAPGHDIREESLDE